MEKAHEQSNIEIGKYYLVAHVTVDKQIFYLNDKPFKAQYLVPVIPIWHDDKAFDFEHKHYHVDGRFKIEAESKKEFNVVNGKTTAVLANYHDNHWQNNISEVFYLKRKCIRKQTGIPIDETIARHGGVKSVSASLKTILNWMETMKGKSCKGRICPHKGAIMQEIDGILICPLHNLKGCVKTEVII